MLIKIKGKIIHAHKTPNIRGKTEIVLALAREIQLKYLAGLNLELFFLPAVHPVLTQRCWCPEMCPACRDVKNELFPYPLLSIWPAAVRNRLFFFELHSVYCIGWFQGTAEAQINVSAGF